MTPAQEIAARYGATVSPDLAYQVIPMGVRGLSYEYIYNPATGHLEPTEATKRDNEMLIKGSAALGRKKSANKQSEKKAEQERRTAQMISFLRSLADEGLTAKQAAERANMSVLSIASLSGHYGVKFRKDTAAKAKRDQRRKAMSQSRAMELLRLRHAEGWGDIQIAQALSMKRNVVSRLRAAEGLAENPSRVDVKLSERSEKIVALRRQGMAVYAIAEVVGVGRRIVRKALEDNGLPASDERASNSSIAARHQKVKALHADGKTTSQIAALCNVTSQTISRDLDDLGLGMKLEDVPQKVIARVLELKRIGWSDGDICRSCNVRARIVYQIIDGAK